MLITCPGCGFTAEEDAIYEDAAAYGEEHRDCLKQLDKENSALAE